jgi:hypothetical protein
MYITYTTVPRRLCYYKNVYTLKSTLSEEEIKILSNCWRVREKVEYKNQESRILFFPILGPQGACKDQNIREWKKQIKKTWHISIKKIHTVDGKHMY